MSILPAMQGTNSGSPVRDRLLRMILFVLIQTIATLQPLMADDHPFEPEQKSFTLSDHETAVLHYPSLARPAWPFAVKLETNAKGSFAIELDGQKTSLQPGVPATIALGGVLGPKKITVFHDGQKLGIVDILLQAETVFEAKPFTDLFSLLQKTVAKDRVHYQYNGKELACQPSWFRDHVHEMKAYKFWEHDLNSFVDTIIDLQSPKGFYYEILVSPTDPHLAYVDAEQRMVDQKNQLAWVRLELEADVEYLMVEAAWTIWQATGDREAMLRRLPSLERALNYCFTDPKRWDEKNGALKRPFTIDTWDFTYGKSDHNRRIEPDTPMAIMHGDNSGLYAACRQLAAMLRVAGEETKAKQWETKAADLRERVNRLCFNGNFYTHQILLQPIETGLKEEEILSLSNPYDINRGLPTHEMAVKIIDEYQRRRKLREKTHFAEWFSIDPPYPMFGPFPAGNYINGGIASFTAGELAKAAFNEGRESYGADILYRLAQKIREDQDVFFLYTYDGKDQLGGPSGWSAAAILSAIFEGLVGIHDETALFEEVTISPKFTAAKIDTAYTCVRYGSSEAYIALDYSHQPAEKTIRLRVASNAKTAHLRLLLPEGTTSAQLISPSDILAKLESIEQSRYFVFDLPSSLVQNGEIRVHYDDTDHRIDQGNTH